MLMQVCLFRKFGYSVFFMLLGGSFSWLVSAQCPVIPQPKVSIANSSLFTLTDQTSLIWSGAIFEKGGRFLQQELLKHFKLPLTVGLEKSTNRIEWRKTALNVISTPGGYTLQMKENLITIEAMDEEGAFNGAVSLLQIIRQNKEGTKPLLVNCWNITDAPAYQWRGFMLDESRHFFGTEEVKKLLDWMAYYKLNKFHWHLTDEPGWRIEIVNYPLLATVGGIGNFNDPYAPALYYKQSEINEIVQYAADRNIDIIPEVDMPGHATAANRAYPAFSGGGNQKHPDFTFNPGLQGTYTYLTNILKEVGQLFRSGMLHLGGDEVSFGSDKWLQDASIKKLMVDEKLTTITDVERYFMRRMADSVYRLNQKLLGWDEIASFGLPKDKTIMFWWRHDQPAQLQTILDKGYSVVCCPRLPFYFDFVQDSTHAIGRKWGKQFNDLQSIYNFSIDNYKAVTSNNKQQVFGVQANLWTETVPDTKRLEFLLFPRMAALAETAWSTKKDFNQFQQNLKRQFDWYKADGINFYDPQQKY